MSGLCIATAPLEVINIKLEIVPIEFDEAKEFVRRHHRHNKPPIGHKFSLAVADEEGNIRGVAIVGRPTARMNQDGFTLEIYRCCSDGCKNACSALYGACCRAAFAIGYRKVITYTHKTEPGTSLFASGFKIVGEVKGRSWSCPSRPRIDFYPLQDKFRWEKV